MIKQKCTFLGCEKYQYSNNLCSGHRSQQRRGKELSLLRESSGWGAYKGKNCLVRGCSREPKVKNYCGTHYSQQKKGKALKILPKEGWRDIEERKKRKFIQQSGYVLVWSPDTPGCKPSGYIFEHRKVMSEYINRGLYKDETVHHKNGNRSDNRIENLELWSKSQPCGQRVEDKLKWAKEIISRYEK